MSLPLYALEHIKKYVLPRMPKNVKPKIAMLSYQDIIAEAKDVFSLFWDILKNKAYQPHEAFRADSNKIKEWHKAKWLKGWVIDTKWLFEQLDFKFDCFDIVKARGDEIFLDLNFNLPQQFIGQYDFVFENCIDHVFNIGTALFNTFQLCKQDGIILHLNPLNIINHGFYNVNPTLYYDLYTQNNCEILLYECFEGIQKKETHLVNNTYKKWESYRPKNPIHKSMQCCIVKKNSLPGSGMKVPTQSKFLSNPLSKL